MKNQMSEREFMKQALIGHMFFADTNEPISAVFFNYNYGQLELVLQGKMLLDMRTTFNSIPKVGFEYPNADLQLRLGQITVTADSGNGEFLVALKKIETKIITEAPIKETITESQLEGEIQKNNYPANEEVMEERPPDQVSKEEEEANTAAEDTLFLEQQELGWYVLAKSDETRVLGVKFIEPEIIFDEQALEVLARLMAGYGIKIKEMFLVKLVD